MKTYTEEEAFQIALGTLASYLVDKGKSNQTIDKEMQSFINKYNLISIIRNASEEDFVDYKKYTNKTVGFK